MAKYRKFPQILWLFSIFLSNFKQEKFDAALAAGYGGWAERLRFKNRCFPCLLHVLINKQTFRPQQLFWQPQPDGRKDGGKRTATAE